jgi:glycosyltransferase involved in cell wall biosynthesis
MLALLPDDVLLKVAGYETVGSLGYVDTLRGRATLLDVSHRVEFVGAIPHRDELLKLSRSCEVGLALMPRRTVDDSMQAMTGASNKPFDYLACGLAVLVSDLPDWCEMFVKPQYGLCCDPADPASVATAVRYFYDNPRARREMAQRGRQKILAEWNYEVQFEKVLKTWAS